MSSLRINDLRINDGVEWLKNKLIKINQVFSNEDVKEGYSILGNQLGTPTGSIIATIEEKKQKSFSDKLILDSSINEVKSGLTNSTTAWKSKALDYLGDKANYDKKRNYNIFVNRSLDPQDINTLDQVYPSRCFKKGVGRQGEWLVESTEFNKAYPAPTTPGSSNFDSYSKAKDACKLLAADTGQILFGITKDATNTNYKCYTGVEDNLPTIDDFSANNFYTVQKSAYTYATAVNTTEKNSSRAQLFYDGRLGVYNYELDNSGKPTNASTPIYNDQMNVPEGYAMCNPWYGGGIKFDSITANFGQNCNNMQNPPLKVRYVLIKHTSDKRIQISALAVYGSFKNQRSANLARYLQNGVTATSDPKLSWSPNPNDPIAGNLSNRNADRRRRGAYFSVLNKNAYWLLDLKQEAQIFQIDYYNVYWRGINQWHLDQAIGMKIYLGTELNNDGSLKVTKELGPLTNGLRQSFPVSGEASTTTDPGKLTPNYIPISSN